MNKRVYFSLVMHNHQPVGNFPDIIENTFNCAYYPFLNVLERFPAMKATLHYSGYLYQWMEQRFPEFIDRIGNLAARGQIEIMTGGFYEPIMLIIPEEDRIAQIEMLNDYIKRRFGVRPKGLWLTERIWDEHLVPSLHESGVEYILIDDIHLSRAGEKNVSKAFYTEHNGFPIKVIPIDRVLRYEMPYGNLSKSIQYIRSKADYDGCNIVCAADDGEKFGDWPGTFEICYEKDWMEELFEQIENAPEIVPVTVSEYLDSVIPEKAYIPPGSYEGMMKWSLGAGEALDLEYAQETAPEEIKELITMGYWPHFFKKYPESDRIHKKMLSVSRHIDRNHKESMEHLFMSQCACAYWHGVFGGIYLPHLRHALWENILAAEKKSIKNGCIETDINGDFVNEIIMRNNEMQIQIWPGHGGQIAELSILKHLFNLQNTVSRRPEYYHTRYFESSADQNVEYDWYDRLSAVDHFVLPELTLEDFSKCDYGEQGDFVAGKYTMVDMQNYMALFERNGSVYSNGKVVPVHLKKRVELSDKALTVSWEIESEYLENVCFAPEYNLTMLSEKDGRYIADSRKKYSIDEKLIIKSDTVVLHDSWKQQDYRLKADNCLKILIFPVKTISLNIEKFEKLYQGSSITPVFELKPGKNQFSVIFEVL